MVTMVAVTSRGVSTAAVQQQLLRLLSLSRVAVFGTVAAAADGLGILRVCVSTGW